MKKVRIAFYKYPMKDWVNFAISGYTWIFNIGTPPYSHCEIGFEFEEGWRYFSSSMPDKGTRWKTAGQTVDKNPERWDVFECEYPEKCVSMMIARAHSIVGKKYDALGIFGFLTISGQVANKKDYWYCSEAVWYVLTGEWVKRISPRRLFSRIKEDFKKVN